MFYSDTLLSKTGPLARVWLAANLERKLGKKDYVTANLENSIEAIVDQGSAPMALRLSGQLLLGVVRIYSRKAKYLLDDCNEALLKIKMAFRPGNVDLGPDQSHTANITSLALPDVLTELDLLAPMPDPMQLFAELERNNQSQDVLVDWGSQSLLTDSIARSNREESRGRLEEEPLDLDLGDDTLPSIELGRRVRISELLDDRPTEVSKLYDDDLPLDLGDDPMQLELGDAEGGAQRSPQLQEDDLPLDLGLDDTLPGIQDLDITPKARRQRDTLSPLSDIAPELERELDETFAAEADDTTVHEIQQQQRPTVKRRKMLTEDRDTEIHSHEIRALQSDRSRILKPLEFLPRDPVLLALMNMQKNGSFVSDILRNGRAAGWAPQLRDILSIEVVKRSGDLKRKRDSGVSDMYLEDGQVQDEQPRLEIPEDDSILQAGGADLGTVDQSILQPRSEAGMEVVPSDAGVQATSIQGDDGPGQAADLDLEEDSGMGRDNFDDTTYPILHPADSGPISHGTRHAVYLLRDSLGPEPENLDDLDTQDFAPTSKTQHKSVNFQDLLPESRTTRAEATKMFFEVLVLATKDAIKVEQGSSSSSTSAAGNSRKSGRQAKAGSTTAIEEMYELGAPIRLRAKRGLWGSWAEERAGGEIEREEGEDGGNGTARPLVEHY